MSNWQLPLIVTKDFMQKKLMIGPDGKILGVCSGFAEYFGIDVTMIRIGWVLFICFGGAGILVYFICAMIMPKR